MAALHPTPARPAPPDADPEPGHRRAHLGQIDLPLILDPLDIDLTATVRAAHRRRRVEHPIGVTGNHPMTMPAMTLATFAARPFRLVCRFALRERRRLSFPGPARVAQQPFQFGDPGVTPSERLDQTGDPRVQRRDLRFELRDPITSHDTSPPHRARNVVDDLHTARTTRYTSTAREGSCW